MKTTRNNPAVSMIIPTYNRANLLCRAIQSALNQTYENFEIIIIDDGSNDNTSDVVEKYQKQDERIRYIRCEKNKGGSAARNKGIKAAKGEYLAFLDDDDEWLPEKIEKQMIKFKNVSNDVGLIYSGFSCISESSGKIVTEINPILRGNVYHNLLENCILGSPTPLIRKICFRKAGLFDETLPSCQDWDMWIRISEYYKFDFVSGVLAKHHVHGDQISIDLNAKIVARKKLIEKYRIHLTQKPQILSVLFKRLGILYCLNGDSKEGFKYFLDSIKRKPFQKGGYLHLLLSFLAPKIHKKILNERNVINMDGVTFYY